MDMSYHGYKIEPRSFLARIKLVIKLLESALQVIVTGKTIIVMERHEPNERPNLSASGKSIPNSKRWKARIEALENAMNVL